MELTVARRDAGAASSEVPALAYTDLMAVPAVGDRVLLNVAALERGLGTGGYALVIAVLDAEGRVAAQPPQPSGHLVKARWNFRLQVRCWSRRRGLWRFRRN